MIATLPPAWRRRGWLALIGGVHVLAFLGWQAPSRPHSPRPIPHEAITYILTPVKAPAPSPLPPPPRTPAVASRERVPLPVVAAPLQPQPITLPAVAPPAPSAEAEQAPQADPFALPDKPAPDLKQRAIAGALAADKEARKASFTQRDRKLVNDESALATAICKAYVGGPSGPIGEISMPDGTRVTKWRLPGGAVVCYYKESNNGLDPFKNSGRVSARSCP